MKDYPPTILESAEHRAQAVAGWEALLAEASIPAERRKVPELQPITHVPVSILGIGPLPLLPASTSPTLGGESRVRAALRGWLERYPLVVGVAASSLSLDSVVPAGGLGNRYEFLQTSYAVPIVAPWGRLDVIVSPAGEIVQISNNLIPAVELSPSAARIERAEAGRRASAQNFEYHDMVGRPQRAEPSGVEVRGLVVLPRWSDVALSIHLAWEVIVGTDLRWTVWVDAVSGQILGTRQNFQT
jgi:hypothetical protein